MILMTVLWVVSTFNFYMISLQVKYFPGDFNMNTIVLFGTDALFYLVGGYLVKKFCAKVVFTSSFMLMSLAGTMIVVFINIDEPGIAFLFLVACARGGNCVNFNALYI